MSTTPWGDQTQLSSGVFGIFWYLPATISCCHSTREKLIRHWSPSLGGAWPVCVLGERLPRNCEFDRPGFVSIARVVECAVDMNGGLEPGDFPLVDRRTAVAIRLFEKQVPLGVEGVDLDLVILVVVAVGVDEDLEVVVVEDDRIVLRKGAPDVRFFEQGPDVEIRVIPEHAGTGLKPRDCAGFGPRMSTKASVQGARCQASSSRRPSIWIGIAV